MVVGHNPGLEELLDVLTGELASLPTAALAQVALDIEHWSQVSQAPLGKLVHIWLPAEGLTTDYVSRIERISRPAIHTIRFIIHCQPRAGNSLHA